MRETRDVDLDYHIRHSALPHPGGQRELGILVSRLHSNQLDLHRPLWEVHLIEGLEGNRFAMYSKIHHSLIDGVSGMRLIMRALSTDPDERGMASFWTVGAGERPRRDDAARAVRSARSLGRSAPCATASPAAGGLSRAALDLARRGRRRPRAAGALPRARARCSADGSAASGALPPSSTSSRASSASRAPPTARSTTSCCTSAAARCAATWPSTRRCPTARSPPASPSTCATPTTSRWARRSASWSPSWAPTSPTRCERLRAIARSTAEAKHHLSELPPEARTSYTLLSTARTSPALVAGLGGHAPIPFNLGISNVPGPTEPLYLNGSRLDSLSPLSLLMHGNALNITCVSYAGTLNFGLTGARDTLPHLQRLAIYMGEALARDRAAAAAQAQTRQSRAARPRPRQAAGRAAKRAPRPRSTARAAARRCAAARGSVALQRERVAPRACSARALRAAAGAPRWRRRKCSWSATACSNGAPV